jgi:hypothetical protein
MIEGSGELVLRTVILVVAAAVLQRKFPDVPGRIKPPTR